MDPPSHADENATSAPLHTLHGSVLASLNAFRLLLEVLNRTANDSSIPAGNEKTQIWEAYSRVRLWAEESNANSPPVEQNSLDELLRSTHDVRKALLDIFIEIQNLLRIALDVAENQDEDVDLGSSIGGLSSSEGTASSTPPFIEPPTIRADSRMSKFTLIVSHITSKVALLFQISNVIRKLQLDQASLESAQTTEGQDMRMKQLNQGENIAADQIHINVAPGSSKDGHEEAKAAQSHSAPRLSNNRAYSKKLSSSMEERQRVLLQFDSCLICTTEHLSMKDWPGVVFEGLDPSLAKRRETPVIQAFYRKLMPLLDSDWIGLWANTDNIVSGEVPERLQINSLFIYQELQQITSIDLNGFVLRMGPPYKLLTHYLTEIETRLEFLQRSRQELAGICRNDPVETNAGKILKTNTVEARWPKHKKSDSDLQLEITTTTIAHLECLTQFIRRDLAPLVQLRQNIQNATLTHISFDDIWHLIKPGDLVVLNDGEEKVQLARAYAVTGGQPRKQKRPADDSLPGQRHGIGMATRGPFQDNDDSEWEHAEVRIDATGGVGTWAPLRIDSYIMCSSGQKIGPLEIPKKIKHFAGMKRVTDLEVYPLAFHEDSTGLLKQMRDRGLRYLDALGHKSYQGLGKLLSEDDRYEEIYGDVFIDPETFYRDNPSQRPHLGRLRKSRPDPSEATETVLNQTSSLIGNQVDIRLSEEYIASTQLHLVPTNLGEFDSTDVEKVALLPGKVVGYSFRARKWFLLDIDDILSISQNHRAFDELVLPDSYKEIIMSQVKNHTSHNQFQRRDTVSEDVAHDQRHFAKGRNRGLVFLLHGAPGTGKTSTTEAVAAYTGRPLYTIAPRDVGTDAEFVDTRLSDHIGRAERWGCILVIDEADVYLERRQITDMMRNAVVTVLLRELEYCSGIIFMTTNRVGVIDDAFPSRIHFSLHYPALTGQAAILIWQNLVRKVKMENKSGETQIKFDSDEINDFAQSIFQENERRIQWNGREICNNFQKGIVLARYKANEAGQFKTVHLDVKDFESIFKMTADFDDYIETVLAGSRYARAYRDRLRNDEFSEGSIKRDYDNARE